MSSSASYTVSPWLTCYAPRPDACLRLFCFPHGGGGPQAFTAWSDFLPEEIEVYSLHLPGWGKRLKGKSEKITLNLIFENPSVNDLLRWLEE